SCSTGSGARLPSRFSRTTHLHKNGAKTGAFRFITGASCAGTIFNGGAKGCALPGGFFIYSASITSCDFIAFTLFHVRPRGTENCCRSTSVKCLNEPAAARLIFFLATTIHPKIAKRTSAKEKNTCASSWKKQAPRV